MSFERVRRLDVWRRLADGSRVLAGTLAQNQQGVFFQYADSYLQGSASLSPFALKFSPALQLAPSAPHGGLHGVFADSLPDGWGLLLMDRVFRQAGVLPGQVSAMDRLAFVGDRGSGALAYEPVSGLQPRDDEQLSRISELGAQAQALYEGDTAEVLNALVRAGSSAGARPKALLYLADSDADTCSTSPGSGLSPWLVKFTSRSLPLGHEEGLCEAAWLTLAKQAGIDVPEWRLLAAPSTSGASAWLALRRFDCTPEGGRLHLHSACGLLDADFRTPSLDYEQLIRASSMLCKSPAAGQQQFRRGAFNLFALNQDDHSKNWAFLQNDAGAWHRAPFYDVNFCPSPHGEHATAFAGFGKRPPLKAMQKLAECASFANWRDAQQVVAEVADSLKTWTRVAAQLGISKGTSALIQTRLNAAYDENKELLGL